MFECILCLVTSRVPGIQRLHADPQCFDSPHQAVTPISQGTAFGYSPGQEGGKDHRRREKRSSRFVCPSNRVSTTFYKWSPFNFFISRYSGMLKGQKAHLVTETDYHNKEERVKVTIIT